MKLFVFGRSFSDTPAPVDMPLDWPLSCEAMLDSLCCARDLIGERRRVSMQKKMRWEKRSGKDMGSVKCYTDHISGASCQDVEKCGGVCICNQAGMRDEMVPYRRR